MAIIVILCGAPHLYKKDMNNSGLVVYPGDLVISRLNKPIGRACLLPNTHDKYVIAVDNVVLRPNSKMYDKLFLKFVMNVDGYSEESNIISRGATMPRISRTLLSNIKIPTPPLIQQQKIANFLDQKVSEIDHILKKTRESIEEYKKYKQSLITEAVTKGLNPDVEMKDSGIEWIGEIPRHWEVKPCKYVANLNTGKTPPTTISRYFNGDITWYKPGDFNADFRLNDSQDKLTTEAINDRAVELNPENTVYFVGVGATVGKIGYSKNKAFCNQQVTALVAKQINSEFLLYLMQSANVYIQNNALYTTLPIINNGYLGSIKFSIPPLIEQIDIVKYINCKLDEINSLISQKETLLSDLETYKKSLIYECVTGKREVD